MHITSSLLHPDPIQQSVNCYASEGVAANALIRITASLMEIRIRSVPPDKFLQQLRTAASLHTCTAGQSDDPSSSGSYAVLLMLLQCLSYCGSK